MRKITIDFETHDPYISRGLGPGWVYGKNVIDSDFEILGAAIKVNEEPAYYETNLNKIKEVCESNTYFIMHNGTYDLGCISYLGVDYSNYTIFDTAIVAAIYDSNLSVSLDNLAFKFLGKRKLNDELINAVIEHDLYPYTKEELTLKSKYEKVNGTKYVRQLNQEVLAKFVKSNMRLIDKVAPEVLAKYAREDADLTYKLFEVFCELVNKELMEEYCQIVCALTDMRERGTSVNFKLAQENSDALAKEIDGCKKEIFNLAGGEFKLNSKLAIVELLQGRDLRLPTTDKGNPSIKDTWLEEQEDLLCQKIAELKTLTRHKNNFIDKIIALKKWCCPLAVDVGVIYPEYRPFATRTGRFNCTGPNIQQTPGKKDAKYAKLCRGIYEPFEGDNLYAPDYAAQEPRILIHFCYLLKLQGAEEFVAKYKDNPNFDMHTEVGERLGIKGGKAVAKPLNLGITYMQGIASLSSKLGVSFEEAKDMKARHAEMFPFMSQFNRELMRVYKHRELTNSNGGYILSLGKRPLRVDPDKDGKSFLYKIANRVMQGSGADLMIFAIIELYKAGIKIIGTVHDELLLSCTKEEAAKAKHIMENVIEMSVPLIVEMKGGRNWYEAGN